MKPGPIWSTYFVASFGVAFVLSCVIEYAVLAPFRRRLRFERLFGTAVIANIVGYVLLASVASLLFVLHR